MLVNYHFKLYICTYIHLVMHVRSPDFAHTVSTKEGQVVVDIRNFLHIDLSSFLTLFSRALFFSIIKLIGKKFFFLYTHRVHHCK